MSVPNAKPSFCETNTVMRYYKSSSGMRVVSSSPFLSFASRLSTRRSSRLTFSYASAPLPPSTCSCCCAFHILCSITLICFSSSAICPTLASLPAPFASFVSIGFFIGSSDSGFGALLPPNDPVQIGAFYASRPRHTSTGTAGIAGASVAGSSFVCRMMSCTLYPRWRRPRGSLHTLVAASLDDTVWVVVLEVSAGSRSNMETLRRRRVGVCAAAVLWIMLRWPGQEGAGGSGCRGELSESWEGDCISSRQKGERGMERGGEEREDLSTVRLQRFFS